MKKILLTFILILTVLFSSAQFHGIFNFYRDKYYVSETGNDSNSGKYPWAAWQTIDKVNASNIEAGKQVLFKKGDSFEGTLTIPTSGTESKPIIYGSYGTGVKPKIYGSEVITGWTVHSGNIYKATLTNDITQLFVDGERLVNARYPKTGYFYIDAVNSTTEIVCDSLDTGIDYSGANIHTRTVQWRLMTTNVASSSNDTITVSSAPGYGFEVDDAFFLNNNLAFLTQAGEWHYDSVANVLYVWTPAGDSPANYEVRGSTRDNNINTGGNNYITIKDLDLREASDDALFSNASDFITVQNVDVYYPEGNGFYITNTRNMEIHYNYIKGAMEDGMYLSNGSISWDGEIINITNNEVRDIAKFDEIGIKGIGTANGIFTRMNNPVLQYNKIYNNGYIGIQFYGQNTFVQYNLVDGYCKTLIDGGGIYTWVGFEGDGITPLTVHSSGSEVRNNIVLNGQDTYGGYNRTPTLGATAYGLYADEASKGVLFQDNIVGNGYGHGIFYNKTVDVVSRSNLLYNTSSGFRLTRSSAVDLANQFSSNIVYHNINTLDAEDPPKMIALSTDGATNTVLDSNIYINRVAAYSDVLFRNLSTFSGMNFASWQTFTTQEGNSSYINTALSANETEVLIYNDSKVAKTYYLNNATSVVNAVTGDVITTDFILQPFTGVVVKGLNVDCILDYSDLTAPAITEFSLPDTSETFEVTISTLTSSGNATAYYLSEADTVPSLVASGWENLPTSYIFSEVGTKHLYVFARDSSGNVSTSATDSVVVTASFVINSADMEAAYHFNETSGTNINDEVGVNDGTATGTTIVAGKLNSAREFDGTDDIATLTTLPAFVNSGMTQDFSINMWVKFPTTVSGTAVIFCGALAFNNGVSIHVNSSNRIAAQITHAGTQTAKAQSSGGTTVDKWYMVTLVWDTNTNTVQLYLDGSEITTSTGGVITYTPNTGYATFGSLYDGTLRENVIVDEVLMVNRKITPTEITELYNSGNGIEYF